MIVDYLGNCNEQGVPLGHPIKIINEYQELLSDNFEVDIMVPANMASHVKGNVIKKLKYSISQYSVGVVAKSRNVLGRLVNIKEILKNKHYDEIWFCNIDFYLFFYLMLYRRDCSKIICTLYRRDFSGDKVMVKLKNRIMYKVLPRLGLVICSNTNILSDRYKCFYMPDYFYIPEKYEPYRYCIKENKVVCLGTMGENKRLYELVKAFNQINYPLEIVGNFVDKELLDKLNAIKGDHIVIHDDYLSEEEYLSRMASAKYCILPYNMELYHDRTSGVVLEAIFLKCIPIAPKELLDFTDIRGISYQELNDLITIDLQYSFSECVERNEKMIEETYNRDLIKSSLWNILE